MRPARSRLSAGGKEVAAGGALEAAALESGDVEEMVVVLVCRWCGEGRGGDRGQCWRTWMARRGGDAAIRVCG